MCLNWASLWRVARNQEWLWGGVKSFLLSVGPSGLVHPSLHLLSETLMFQAACVHADRDSSLLFIALAASVGFWREKAVVVFQLSSTFTTQLPHHHSSYVWMLLQHTQRTVPGDLFPSPRTSPGSFSEHPCGLQQMCRPKNSLDPTRQSNFAYGNSYFYVTFPRE